MAAANLTSMRTCGTILVALSCSLAGGACTEEESEPVDAPTPGPGHDPGPVDGTHVGTYRVQSDFNTDFGPDPGITAAVEVLRPFAVNPSVVVGEWMSGAAPGRETEVAAAVSSSLAENYYWVAAAVREIEKVMTESAYRNFLLNQSFHIVEKDGKQTLDHSIWGVTLWSQRIINDVNVGWAIRTSLYQSIRIPGVTFRYDKSTMIIDHHSFKVPFAALVKVLAPLDGEGRLLLDVSCLSIARSVAEKTALQAAPLQAACEEGKRGLEQEFDTAVANITGTVDFAVSATATVVDGNGDGTPDRVESGRWSGAFTTPWSGETILGETEITPLEDPN